MRVREQLETFLIELYSIFRVTLTISRRTQPIYFPYLSSETLCNFFLSKILILSKIQEVAEYKYSHQNFLKPCQTQNILDFLGINVTSSPVEFTQQTGVQFHVILHSISEIYLTSSLSSVISPRFKWYRCELAMYFFKQNAT